MTVIYAIECIVNRRVYVGCTASRLNRRLNEHRSMLRKKKHSAASMVSDCEQFGDKAFWLKILEVLEPNASVEVRREAELRWMHHYADLGLLYNAYLTSFSPSGDWKKKTQSPEARMKRSLALRGKPKHPGHGAKISATKKALGQRPSPEAIRRGNIACLKKRYGKTDEIV